MTRAQKRRQRYFLAGKPERDYKGEYVEPSEVAIAARRARIDKAIALRISDQTGIGFR